VRSSAKTTRFILQRSINLSCSTLISDDKIRRRYLSTPHCRFAQYPRAAAKGHASSPNRRTPSTNGRVGLGIGIGKSMTALVLLVPRMILGSGVSRPTYAHGLSTLLPLSLWMAPMNATLAPHLGFLRSEMKTARATRRQWNRQLHLAPIR